MNDIERIINHCTKQMDRFPSDNHIYKEHEATRHHLQLYRHLLQEKAERDKGCEYCNIEINSYSETILNQDSETGVYLYRDRKGKYDLCCNSGVEFKSIKGKVCFNCGRDLRKGEDNAID